jgi:hypothetical protein
VGGVLGVGLAVGMGLGIFDGRGEGCGEMYAGVGVAAAPVTEMVPAQVPKSAHPSCREYTWQGDPTGVVYEN